MTFVKLTDNAGVSFQASSEASAGWVLQNIDGLFGGVGVRVNNTDRLYSGTFEDPVYRTGRELTLTGLTDCADVNSADILAHNLSSIFPSQDDGMAYGMLEVTREGRLMTAEVRLDGKPTITVSRDRFGSRDGRIVSWEIPLYAPDYRLFGVTHHTTVLPEGSTVGLTYPLFSGSHMLDFNSDEANGPKAITNYGSIDTHPIIKVYGVAPNGFSLTLGGTSVTYDRPLIDGVPVTIDTSGSIYSGSYQVTGQFYNARFAGIPGETTELCILTVLQNNGTAWADIAVQDTYM